MMMMARGRHLAASGLQYQLFKLKFTAGPGALKSARRGRRRDWQWVARATSPRCTGGGWEPPPAGARAGLGVSPTGKLNELTGTKAP